MKRVFVFNLTLLVALVVAVSGCGGESKQFTNAPLGKAGKVKVQSSEGFNKDQQQVLDKVVEYADVTASRNYEKLCKEVLSDSASQLEGGCVAMFRKSGLKFKDFSVTVKSIKVADNKSSATVAIVSRTDVNKTGTAMNLSLQKSSGQWRINILGK